MKTFGEHMSTSAVSGLTSAEKQIVIHFCGYADKAPSGYGSYQTFTRGLSTLTQKLNSLTDAEVAFIQGHIRLMCAIEHRIGAVKKQLESNEADMNALELELPDRIALLEVKQKELCDFFAILPGQGLKR